MASLISTAPHSNNAAASASPVKRAASAATSDGTERAQIAASLAAAAGGSSAEEQSFVLLHLIRVLALFLCVHLVQQPLAAGELARQSLDGADAAVSALERELHALLLALVESEVASNQFDGVVRERLAFSAMRRLFRARHVQTAAQCRALAALLATYLSLLQAPIVACAPFSMVLSTLEYLARGSNAKDAPLPLLYPIVNAIDSLRIEQRECLDALTTLWKQLAACDPSDMVLAKIASRHHAAIIEVAAASGARADLGACFVATLLHHSDHIFRRDPEFAEPPAPLESDTEDDDDEAAELAPSVAVEPQDDDGDACASKAAPDATPAAAPAKVPTLPRLTAAEVEVATPSPRRRQQQQPKQQAAKGLTKAMRRRKKKGEDKAVAVVGAAALAQQQLKQQRMELEAADSGDAAAAAIAPAPAKSLPAAICVGIAAAAGTIAAALCVIFT